MRLASGSAVLFCSLLCLPAAGCSGPRSDSGNRDPRLVALAGCPDALDYVKQVERERMNRRLDAQIDAYMRGEVCGWGYGDASEHGGTPPPSTPPSTPPAPGDHASEGTGTNNQVAGVDEADFVKNDGKYIYLAQNGVLRIVEAWPAPQTHEVSVTPLPGTPKKLFVSGDRALVYVSLPAPGSDTTYPAYDAGECTYGYDCDFVGDGSATKLLVFDLGDRTAPSLKREIELSGSLIAARRVGNAVHTVVSDNRVTFPEVRDWPDEDICGYQSASGGPPPFFWQLRAADAFRRLRERNLRAIAEADLSAVVPMLRDSAFLDTGAPDQLCTQLYSSAQHDGMSFISVVSLDLSACEPVTSATIVGGGGAVYASGTSLYIAEPHRDPGGESTLDTSSVHAFRISTAPSDTAYLGSGAVAGRALNQFAMDEHEGFLRIATTTGHVPDPDVESQLTVLALQGDELVEVGSLQHIAPNEDIRAVRFDGTRVFVVTFKKTDPLFVFDLSDPTAPLELGELQIPGFSTYLHMLDDDHLLTIGYDADDHGSFAFFDGVMLQVFDVSDMSAPELVHKQIIGTRGSSSEALTNHLAFTYYPSRSLLAVPMTICEGGDDGSFGTDLTFSGLMVFDISLANGISERGRVSEPLGPDLGCSNWWSHGSSAVERSLFLEDYVYSISDAHLRVQSIAALGTDLVDLPLTP